MAGSGYVEQNAWRRWRGRLLAVLVALAVLYAIWMMAGHHVGVRREAPPIATLTPLPPPPPPPKEKPPEPKKEEVKEEVPKPLEPLKPVEAPKQAPDLAKQITINGPAQAGADAFNIGAGEGGGMVGSGGGGGGTSYEQYLGYALQEAIQRDDRTKRLVFDVRVNLWLSSDGGITRVVLVNSTGVASTDQALIDVLRSVRIDTPPPPNLNMPVRVAMRGYRPG
jgi:periplasmic protein TonB